jgi:hypothetical protein
MKKYAKALAMVAATALSAIYAAISDGHVDNGETITIVTSVLGAAAVFAAPNVPGARYTKAILAVLTAVATLVIGAYSDGHLTGSEIIQIILAGLGAVGVAAVPNMDHGVNLSNTGSLNGQVRCVPAGADYPIAP